MTVSKGFAAAAALVVAGAFAPAQAVPSASGNNAFEDLAQLNCSPSEWLNRALKYSYLLERMPENNEVNNGTVVLYGNEANNTYVMVLELSDETRAANDMQDPVSCMIGRSRAGLKEFRASPVFQSIFPKP